MLPFRSGLGLDKRGTSMGVGTGKSSLVGERSKMKIIRGCAAFSFFLALAHIIIIHVHNTNSKSASSASISCGPQSEPDSKSNRPVPIRSSCNRQHVLDEWHRQSISFTTFRATRCIILTMTANSARSSSSDIARKSTIQACLQCAKSKTRCFYDQSPTTSDHPTDQGIRPCRRYVSGISEMVPALDLTG